MNHAKAEAKEIFLNAIDCTSPKALTRYLDEACAGDLALRGRVEELLRARRKAGSFLGGLGNSATEEFAISEGPGNVIGHYKLLQQIGDGGMGVVFMAEQTEPLQRTVALKIIKPGMDTRQVIARFEAERQALAMMDHPNIAKVLDAGTTDSSRPYFVMELVKGVPITTYCDEKHLSLRDRLELFKPVCEAVQHAHQKGIIHRDIKPNNVLVAEYDNHAVPKVIDFGVAKATAQKLTERTMFTEFGQVIGTVEYMSPEQAKFNQLDIDTRSDIYSLGVLLYELLAGSPPFERNRLQSAALDEALRIIREEEPPKPSTRLSTSNAIPSIAANRHSEPAQLSKAVRGELDWIVMKCLEKDRNRRYETPSGFAADLERYLEGETVLACPPSAGYRLRKFASRNKASLVAGSIVAAAMLLGLFGTTWQAIRAEKARQAEAEQRSIAEAARETAETERKTAESQRAEADKNRIQAEANFAMARQAVDEYFTRVSESELFDVPGLEPLRGELLESALKFYEKFSVDRANDPAVLADLASTYLRVAVVSSTLNRNDEAVAALDKAQSLIDRLLQEFPQARDQHRRLAGFWVGMRPAHRSTVAPKNPAAALQTIAGLITTWEDLARQFPDELGFQSDLAAINYAAGDLLGIGQAAKAIPYFERARFILQGLVNAAPTNPLYRDDLARARDQLARAFPQVGRDADAEVECQDALLLRERLVEDFPHAPQYRNALTTSLKRYSDYVRKHDPAEADKLEQRAQEIAESLSRDYPNMPLYRWLWLVSRVEKGDEVEIAKVLQFLDDCVANSPESPARRDELARLLRRVAEALPQNDEYRPDIIRLHRTSLQMFQELERNSPNNPSYREGVGHAARQLAFALGPSGDLEEKRRLFEFAAKAFEQLSKADIDQRDGYYLDYHAASLKHLALVLADSKQLDYGESAARQAAEIHETLARKYPDNAQYRQNVARSMGAQATSLRAQATLLAEQGKLTEALDTAQKAVRLAPNDFYAHAPVLDILTRLGDPKNTLSVMRKNVADMPGSGMAHHHLATALYRQDRHEEAIPEFRKAIELEPMWEWPHLCIASSYASLGQWEVAGDEYAKGFEMDPPSWWKVVESLKAKQNPVESEQVLRKLISVAYERADEPQVRLIRGKIHRELGERDKAIEDASWVIDQDRKSVEAWELRGQCYLDKAEHAKAEENYAAAIKLNPERAAFWTGRAFSQFHRQHWVDAVADFSEAAKLDPKVHTNLFHRGIAYMQLSEYERAAADFSKVIEGWGHEPGGWYLRATAYSQMDEPDLAVADLRQAIATGFRDIEKLQTDRQLDLLRSNMEFKDLLVDLESRAK